MSIANYADRIKPAGILYVDTYVYHRQPDGTIWHLALKRRADGLLPDTWQSVSGKLKAGEALRVAFTRQTKLKTGRTPSELHALDNRQRLLR